MLRKSLEKVKSLVLEAAAASDLDSSGTGSPALLNSTALLRQSLTVELFQVSSVRSKTCCRNMHRKLSVHGKKKKREETLCLCASVLSVFSCHWSLREEEFILSWRCGLKRATQPTQTHRGGGYFIHLFSFLDFLPDYHTLQTIYILLCGINSYSHTTENSRQGVFPRQEKKIKHLWNRADGLLSETFAVSAHV